MTSCVLVIAFLFLSPTLRSELLKMQFPVHIRSRVEVRLFVGRWRLLIRALLGVIFGSTFNLQDKRFNTQCQFFLLVCSEFVEDRDHGCLFTFSQTLFVKIQFKSDKMKAIVQNFPVTGAFRFSVVLFDRRIQKICLFDMERLISLEKTYT